MQDTPPCWAAAAPHVPLIPLSPEACSVRHRIWSHQSHSSLLQHREILNSLDRLTNDTAGWEGPRCSGQWMQELSSGTTMICCEASNKQSAARAAQSRTCSSSLHSAEGQTGILAVSLPSSSALTARDRVLEEHSVPSPAGHLPLRCRNSLPGSLTQIETDEV